MIESLTRIYALLYRSAKSLGRNTFRLADVVLWPMIFLFTLTFFVTYLGSDQVYINMIIMGMMGWRMIYFLNLEMVSSFVEEYWSKSLAHLMMSPISRLEFALGTAASGMLKALFVIATYLVATNVLYGFTVPDWPSFLLALFFFALIGFSMGLITLGLGYYMKEEAFNIAFIWPDVIVLLSGVYFSVEAVYPEWLVPIIRLLPSTQAFELMKSIIGLGRPDMFLLAATTAAWVGIAYVFNGRMFESARKAGKLARLG
ncbi:MAG: ABC transporter permease [Candidatus Micrarchaeota archaeon]